MTRKFRLVSSDNVEIAVTGISSSFLDTLLTDHPHKVATINIPFTANTVLEFVKTVANQERQINRDVADRIVSIYRLLGVDIEVTNDDSNTTEDIEEASVLDHSVGEPKYIIKIEIEQQTNTNPSEISAMHESSMENESVSPSSQENEYSSTPIEVDVPQSNSNPQASQTNLENEENSSELLNNSIAIDQSQSNIDIVQTSQINLEIEENCHSVQPTNPQPEIDHSREVLDEAENTVQGQSDNSPHNSVVLEYTSDLSTGTMDENMDAEFSFHDLEEEPSFQLDVSSEPINPNPTIFLNETNNSSEAVITQATSSNIIAQISSKSTHKTPKTVPSTHPDSPRPLTLQFIYKNIPLIKDIAKKRKRKRGQK
eukprot:GFUD01041632.1.p1 GENE.GFUD01041632.1~~GFUD01041632.1.p1  ORF type:complete len:370 (-),score=102.28 GFUD01041632.1:115-1224(-)